MADGFTYEDATRRYRVGSALLPDGETRAHVSIVAPIGGKGCCVRLWAESPFVDDSLNPSVYLGEYADMDSAEKACDDPLERISNVHRPVGSNSER